MTHVATPPPFRVLSLFSGVGGLDLGIKIAHPGARVVGHVEREPYAAAALVARMEDAALDQAVIWDDVTTFDGHPWRGRVDCIAGGFPCQDISTAGRQEGIRKGNRSGLWFEFGRIIGEVGPQYVFVENVSALALRGLDIVLGTLADLGFDAEWITLGAGDVGAPHQRDRLFILAHRQGERFGEAWGHRLLEPKERTGGSITGLADASGRCLPDARRGPEGRDGADKSGEDLAHAGCQRLDTVEQEPVGGRSGPAAPCEAGADLADPERGRPQDESGLRPQGRKSDSGGVERELADPDGARCPAAERSDVDAARESAARRGEVADAADSDGGGGVGGAEEGTGAGGGGRRGPPGGGPELGDAERAGCEGAGHPGQEGRGEPVAPDGDGRDVPLFPPGPGDFDGWGRVVADGSYDFRAPAVKPGLRVLVDGVALVVDESRADQLRCSGNGVVAIQAAVAFTELVRRIDANL